MLLADYARFGGMRSVTLMGRVSRDYYISYRGPRPKMEFLEFLCSQRKVPMCIEYQSRRIFPPLKFRLGKFLFNPFTRKYLDFWLAKKNFCNLKIGGNIKVYKHDWYTCVIFSKFNILRYNSYANWVGALKFSGWSPPMFLQCTRVVSWGLTAWFA